MATKDKRESHIIGEPAKGETGCGTLKPGQSYAPSYQVPGTVRVRFLRLCGAYNGGDEASFAPKLALEYVKVGAAEFCDEKVANAAARKEAKGQAIVDAAAGTTNRMMSTEGKTIV